MGIDIPPPKGGPATFVKIASTEHQTPLTPERDKSKSVEASQESEQNDAMSLCLSEGKRNPVYKKESVNTSNFVCQ